MIDKAWRKIALEKEFLLKKISFAQFLDWCDEDTMAEWVNGEIIMASPASNVHQDLNGFLITLLRIYVRRKNLGWVRTAPFLMRLPMLSRGREPDLLFVSSSRMDIVKDNYLDGAADLAVEIVSKESIERDRSDKFIEYKISGILEYWLIDPLRKRADFYQLDTKGHYELILGGRSGTYHSKVLPGFFLKIEWFWQDPLPDELDVLSELGISSRRSD